MRVLWCMVCWCAAVCGLAQPSALLHTYRFRQGATMAQVQLVLELEAKTITFGADGSLRAPSTLVQLLVEDSAGTVIAADKVRLKAPQLQLDEEPIDWIPIAFSFSLPQATYSLRIQLVDELKNTANRQENTVPLDLRCAGPAGLSISDVFFADGSKPMQHGRPVPLLNPFFEEKDSTPVAYVELYNHEAQSRSVSLALLLVDAGTDRIVRGFSKIIKRRLGQESHLQVPVQLATLPSGTYKLTVQLLDSANRIVAFSQQRFAHSNPAQDEALAQDTDPGTSHALVQASFVGSLPMASISQYLESLQPLASAKEYATIQALISNQDTANQRSYFLEFWRRRNRFAPEVAFEDFRRNYEYAQRNYRVPTMKVHETSRGRVLLKYGRPNQVDNEYSDRQRNQLGNGTVTPYEVWTYYRIENLKQNNVQFVFVQLNQGNDYTLMHSTAIGEPQFPQWRQSLLERSNTGNSFQVPTGQ